MRLRTIGPVVTLALGLLAGPLPAEAQQVGKVYRIGFLDCRLRSTTTDPWLVTLRQGLRELGWVEGKNIAIEYRWAARRPFGWPSGTFEWNRGLLV